MVAISNLLATDSFIIVNKALIRLFGLNEAVMLGELCREYNYWHKQGMLKDNMFYSTRENIEENTGLSEHLQRKALNNLIDEDMITVHKQGMPAVNYYTINFDKLFKILTTSDARYERQVIQDIQLNNNKQIIVNKKQSISKDIDCNISQKPEFEFGKSCISSKGVRGIEKCSNFLLQYNQKCFNLPRANKLTDRRIKAIKHILIHYTKEEIDRVFELANNSPFLTGNNDRGWKADIDFILRDDKFVNILEGKYNSKTKINKQASSDMGRKVTRMTEEQKRQFKEDIASGKAKKF